MAASAYERACVGVYSLHSDLDAIPVRPAISGVGNQILVALAVVTMPGPTSGVVSIADGLLRFRIRPVGAVYVAGNERTNRSWSFRNAAGIVSGQILVSVGVVAQLNAARWQAVSPCHLIWIVDQLPAV